jgi:hypothetical protein
LEAREREWAEKLDHVESDRDQWKRLVEVEKVKNSKLIDQVVRKDQDIHRMLQRKVRVVPGRICFLCVCEILICSRSLVLFSCTPSLRFSVT